LKANINMRFLHSPFHALWYFCNNVIQEMHNNYNNPLIHIFIAGLTDHHKGQEESDFWQEPVADSFEQGTEYLFWIQERKFLHSLINQASQDLLCCIHPIIFLDILVLRFSGFAVKGNFLQKYLQIQIYH
jgi:hypothetical protein